MTTADDDRTPLSALRTPESYIAYLEADTRFRLDQATQEAAALRGAFGVERQLLAMSARYKALKAAGKLSEAQAIRAEGLKILQASKAEGA
jgi:hypothetical protein